MLIICPGTLRFFIDCENSRAQIAGAITLISNTLRCSSMGPSATEY